MTEKPLCLRIEDAKSEIAAVINRHRTEGGLPCFILEPILKDFYTQIANGKVAEIEAVKREYETTKKKEKKDDDEVT